MKNKLILKILACAMAGISVFSFAGCKSCKSEEAETPPVTEGPEEIGGDNDGGSTGDGNTNDGNTNGGNTNDGNTNGGNTNDGNTNDGNTNDGNTGDGSSSYQDHEQPDIKNNPVAGSVEITSAKGDLEAAYVTSGELIITVDRECTVTLYVLNERTFELDGSRTAAPTALTGEGISGYSITLQLDEGVHSIKKGSGENAIFYAVLTPKG